MTLDCASEEQLNAPIQASVQRPDPHHILIAQPGDAPVVIDLAEHRGTDDLMLTELAIRRQAFQGALFVDVDVNIGVFVEQNLEVAAQSLLNPLGGGRDFLDAPGLSGVVGENADEDLHAKRSRPSRPQESTAARGGLVGASCST